MKTTAREAPRRARRPFATLALVSMLCSIPAVARGEPTCRDAYTEAQELRRQAHLIDARTRLLACAQPSCPEIVRADCVKWLREVDDALPSIVLRAQGARGGDITDVRAFVDGVVATEKLDGKAIPIDPGEHRLRFEHAGAPPIEQTVLVAQGEKNRVVSVTFGGGAAGPKAPPETPPPTESGGGIPTTAYVFGGVGVVAIGVFAYFGVKGTSDLDDLRSSCAPHCSESEVEDVRNELRVSDVALLAGIVSLGVATVLTVTSLRRSAGVSPSVLAPSRRAGRGQANLSLTF